MFVTLSPAYAVRNEIHVSFLIRVDKIIDRSGDNFGAFCIPPFMGYILAHIGDYEYERSIKEIGNSLNVSEVAVDKFVRQLINNEEKKEFRIDDTQSVVLPASMLIQTADKQEATIFEENGFNGLGNYVVRRPSAPVSANLMVTTNCITDCIYCYANRKLKPVLYTDKILSVIEELHNQGTVNVSLTGGDIFAHPDWRDILRKVRLEGYKPFLSTKTPLNSEQISFLREMGYNEIQFSLDSSDADILSRMVNVGSEYLRCVEAFLCDCSASGLDVLIRSVLTKLNASIDRVTALYDFLSKFGCVKEWVMTPAFFSAYKAKEYASLEVRNEDLKDAYDFSKKENLAFRVGLNKITKDGYVLKRFADVEEFVCGNQICMGNTTCISILANGDCSVCEMLYDNPEFLLGNVSESSIKEIWNSDKALALYSMNQMDFPQDSACKDCRVFDKCRNGYGKRVCYIDIAKTSYSKYSPDPRCPLAEDCGVIL